jgi:hypothetical protein
MYTVEGRGVQVDYEYDDFCNHCKLVQKGSLTRLSFNNDKIIL